MGSDLRSSAKSTFAERLKTVVQGYLGLASSVPNTKTKCAKAASTSYDDKKRSFQKHRASALSPKNAFLIIILTIRQAKQNESGGN